MAERERKRLATRNSTYRASLIAGVEEPGMFGESLLGKLADRPAGSASAGYTMSTPGRKQQKTLG
jgi:hypothetical protein